MKIGRAIVGILCVAFAVYLYATAQPLAITLIVLALGIGIIASARNQKGARTPLLKQQAVQTIIASLGCILLGLLIGYIVLLIINPDGAWKALSTILENFWSFSSQRGQIKNFGNTLAKTVPLLMCALSVLFSYKVGLFNIGAAGQYVAGAGVAIYFAIALKMPWWVCMLAAMLAGAALAAISGVLKATRNVNEVISGIMLNWICLYLVNMLLVPCQDINMSETFSLKKGYPQAVIPTLGLNELFNNHQYITIAVPMAILIALLIWYIMTKTKLGYELRATGLNKDAAKYAGMKGRTNIILTMAISGALAGLGASMLYLTDMAKWPSAVAAVPGMGFNGIAAAFLGGLHPIGAVFSSFFIQHITDGGSFMEKIYPAEIASLVSSVIIYMCAFVLYFRQTMTKAVDNRIERRHAALVSNVRGTIHGELEDDFRSVVHDELEKSRPHPVSLDKPAARTPEETPAARPAEPQADEPVRPVRMPSFDWDDDWEPLSGDSDEDTDGEKKEKKKDKKDKNDKKDKKDKKSKKGGSDK